METRTVSISELTPVEAAVAGAVMGTITVFAIIWCILLIIAGWRILKKAGQPGWKILIPIYDVYIMYKIVGMKAWFWISFLGSILLGFISSIVSSTMGENGLPIIYTCMVVGITLSIVVTALYSYRLSKAFHHGVWYAIGIFLLQGIFTMVLAFGESKYDKKILKN